MSPGFILRQARIDELAVLQRIEQQADEVYRRVALGRVLDMPTASLGVLAHARRRGWLWVAANQVNRAVGFALLTTVAGEAYLYQLSVLAQTCRRGIGSALVEAVCETARRAGHETLLLSTYAHVQWNAPFYGRRGFRIVPQGSYSRAMRDLRCAERRIGHLLWRRVLMRRAL